MGNDIVAASAAQERLMAGRGAARVEPRRSVSGGLQQTQLAMQLSTREESPWRSCVDSVNSRTGEEGE
jgi:hypothetical protein